MEIKDNTSWETNPCIWIEDGDIEIDIEKDEVTITCEWDNGYAGRGTQYMSISRVKLLELLAKMDEV